tara:strand:- start:418 stop:1446 length:1029 start_codon:yes stop_codon:yes gene_type:complete
MRSRSNSYGKKRLKVNEEDFKILPPDKFIDFLDYDYNVKQLKNIIKEYNKIIKDNKNGSCVLKLSGNKNELNNRIYYFMRNTYFITKLQSHFRRYLIYKFYKIIKRNNKINNKDYNNDTDFYTMDKISSICPIFIYYYTDEDNFNYRFRITSLIKQFKMKVFLNPYNRKVFEDNTISDILFIARVYSLYTNLCENNDIEIDSNVSNKQSVITGIRDIFHTIDLLGNYTDPKWFLDLNRRQITIFIKELYDIWNYRAQLNEAIKYEICPLNGNPFMNIGMHNINRSLEYNYLQEQSLKIMKNMINTTASDTNKSLAALYILSALTIVSDIAADSMPWLYQSVM